MTTSQGRTATKPYRVRAAGVWYWVDPTARNIEPGDAVVLYPVEGEAHLAVLQSPWPSDKSVAFSTPEGERFEVPASEIATLHLATADDEQD